MPRIKPEDKPLFTLEQRLKSIMDTPEYSGSFARLLTDLCNVCKAYMASKTMHQKSWRQRYTTGLKLRLVEVARTLDSVVSNTMEWLTMAPQACRSILGSDLYDEMLEICKAPAIDGKSIMRLNPKTRGDYEHHKKKRRRTNVRLQEDSQCYPQGQPDCQQDG